MEIKNKLRIAEIKMRRSYQFEQYQTQSLEMTALVPEHLQTEPHSVCDAMMEVMNTQLSRMQQNPPKLLIAKSNGTNVSDKLWNEINIPKSPPIQERVSKQKSTEKIVEQKAELPKPEEKPKRQSRGRGRPKKNDIPPAYDLEARLAEKERLPVDTEIKKGIDDLVAEVLELPPQPDLSENIEDKIAPGERDALMSKITGAYYAKVNTLDFDERNQFIERATGGKYRMWGDVICVDDMRTLEEILTNIQKTPVKR